MEKATLRHLLNAPLLQNPAASKDASPDRKHGQQLHLEAKENAPYLIQERRERHLRNYYLLLKKMPPYERDAVNQQVQSTFAIDHSMRQAMMLLAKELRTKINKYPKDSLDGLVDSVITDEVKIETIGLTGLLEYLTSLPEDTTEVTDDDCLKHGWENVRSLFEGTDVTDSQADIFMERAMISLELDTYIARVDVDIKPDEPGASS